MNYIYTLYKKLTICIPAGVRRLSSKETSIVTSNAFTTTTAVRDSTYIPLSRAGDSKAQRQASIEKYNQESESPLLRQTTNVSEVWREQNSVQVQTTDSMYQGIVTEKTKFRD